jgi:hypothetical protein
LVKPTTPCLEAEHAVQVGLHHVPPQLVGDLGGAPAAAATRVVHQHTDRPEALDRGLDQRVDLFRGAHVAGTPVHFVPLFAQSLDSRVHLRRVAGAQEDLMAAFGQQGCDRRADTTGRAGDHGDAWILTRHAIPSPDR